MTLKQQILNTQTYKLGYLVCPGRLCKVFKVSREEVREACRELVREGLLEVREGETGFRKPERKPPKKHWIHKSLLCDHEGLTAARLSA